MFKTLTPIISVDLDSTLADTRHRKGIIEKFTNAGLPIDWTEYAKACAEDAPTGLVAFLRMYQTYTPWIVVSGRSDGAREGTLAWLEKQGLHPVRVFLEDGRTEQHTTMGHTAFKTMQVLEAAEKMAADGYRVIAHFDDWPDVAASIREQSGGAIDGITVTPPGAQVVFPSAVAAADNPGEKQEVL